MKLSVAVTVLAVLTGAEAKAPKTFRRTENGKPRKLSKGSSGSSTGGCYENPVFGKIVSLVSEPESTSRKLPVTFQNIGGGEEDRNFGPVEVDSVNEVSEDGGGWRNRKLQGQGIGGTLNYCASLGGYSIIVANVPRAFLGCYPGCEFDDAYLEAYCTKKEGIRSCAAGSGYAVVDYELNVFCCSEPTIPTPDFFVSDEDL